MFRRPAHSPLWSLRHITLNYMMSDAMIGIHHIIQLKSDGNIERRSWRMIIILINKITRVLPSVRSKQYWADVFTTNIILQFTRVGTDTDKVEDVNLTVVPNHWFMYSVVRWFSAGVHSFSICVSNTCKFFKDCKNLTLSFVSDDTALA